MLLYGREMTSKRFEVWRKMAEEAGRAEDDAKESPPRPLRLVPVTDASRLSSIRPPPPPEASEDEGETEEILVVQHTFAAAAEASELPDVVRDAAVAALGAGRSADVVPPPSRRRRKGMKIVTELWLARHLREARDDARRRRSGGGGPAAASASAAARFRIGDDATAWMERTVFLPPGRRGGTPVEGGSDRSDARRLSDEAIENESGGGGGGASGGGIGDGRGGGGGATATGRRIVAPASGPPVISLESESDDDDDDEVEVVERPPERASDARAVRNGKRIGSPQGNDGAADAVGGAEPSSARKRRISVFEKPMPSRRGPKNPRPGMASASRKRDVVGLERTKRIGGGKPLEGSAFLAASPEVQVYSRASEFMRLRKRRGQTFKYAFEKCHEQMKQDEEARSSRVAAASATRSGGFSAAVVEEENRGEIRERNRSVAARMRRLISAEAALAQLNLRKDTGMHGGCFPKSSQVFRERQYERVAREVEAFPVPVTLGVLELPDDIRRESTNKYGAGIFDGASSSLLDRGFDANRAMRERGDLLRRIKCGGSVARRLVRSILRIDRGWLLQGDEGHARDERMLRNDDVAAALELRTIWGVGTSAAARLASRYGVRTVPRLRANAEAVRELTEQQRVGLARYDDLRERIPREEVTRIWKHVSDVAAALSGNRVVAIAGGSYRRGSESCGDVDIILLPNRGWKNIRESSVGGGAPDDAALQVMGKLLRELKATGFLTDDLSVPAQFTGHEKAVRSECISYMGVCRLLDGKNRRHRHIDIKAYPGCQGAFALLYFTGDAHFNRSLRLFAKKAGMTLSDSGLACCERKKVGNKWVKAKVFDSVSCGSEEEVFDVLGIDYVPPPYRSCLEQGDAKGQNVKRWTAFSGHDSDDDGGMSD